MDFRPPIERIFGFTVALNVISTPSGSSPVVGLAVMVSKQCIGDDGEGPDHVSKFS
jgi:hypothetical protein